MLISRGGARRLAARTVIPPITDAELADLVRSGLRLASWR